MEISRRIWDPLLVRWAYEAKRNELAIDRLCAVRELGMVAFGARPQFGVRGGSGGALYPPGCQSHWLRTIVIFALIHVRSCRSPSRARAQVETGLGLEGGLRWHALACGGRQFGRLDF